jgi:hypothetical protein
VCLFKLYRSPAKGWKQNTILSKGMGRVNMRVFSIVVEEGSQPVAPCSMSVCE